MPWYMRARIPRMYQAALLQLPLATPTLIRLDAPRQAALAMRVTDLFSFRRAGTALTAKLIGYHGKEGVWVVAVVFRLTGGRAGPCEGVACLNPKRADELSLLRQLTMQERLPVVFLSPRLTIAVGKDAPWPVQQRQEARLLLARLDSPAPEHETKGDGDPAYEAAKAEFRRLYPVTTLLLPHTEREAPLSSLFRGAVLD
ncbi:MAG: hypothetical protein AB1671_03495 [Thermodesulfobacteriota bacterium]